MLADVSRSDWALQGSPPSGSRTLVNYPGKIGDERFMADVKDVAHY